MFLMKAGWAAIVMVLAGCSASEQEIGSTEDLANEQATVHFREGTWAPTWTGSVRGGRTLKVDYDFARLPQCRNQNRIDSWVVEVSYRFDGGSITTKALPGSPGAADTDDTISVPPGAHGLELWFENRGVGADACTAWDSQFGANYTRTL